MAKSISLPNIKKKQSLITIPSGVHCRQHQNMQLRAGSKQQQRQRIPPAGGKRHHWKQRSGPENCSNRSSEAKTTPSFSSLAPLLRSAPSIHDFRIMAAALAGGAQAAAATAQSSRGGNARVVVSASVPAAVATTTAAFVTVVAAATAAAAEESIAHIYRHRRRRF